MAKHYFTTAEFMKTLKDIDVRAREYRPILARALDIMKVKGWTVQSSPIEFGKSEIENNQLNVSVSMKISYFKNGVPMSKESWDDEMREVTEDLVSAVAEIS